MWKKLCRLALTLAREKKRLQRLEVVTDRGVRTEAN